MEDISLSFSTGTAVPVGVDILVCNGCNLTAMTILGSPGKYLLLPDKVTVFHDFFYIAQDINANRNDVTFEKCKEISSNIGQRSQADGLGLKTISTFSSISVSLV